MMGRPLRPRGATVTGMSDERRCDDFVVHDGERELNFCGHLLGASDSRKPGSERWAEISIYRTAEGRYIVAGIGRSIREGEVDKRWAHVCEEAPGVIAALYQVDGDDIRYMTRVSARALEQAMSVDPGLERAYSCETIG